MQSPIDNLQSSINNAPSRRRQESTQCDRMRPNAAETRARTRTRHRTHSRHSSCLRHSRTLPRHSREGGNPSPRHELPPSPGGFDVPLGIAVPEPSCQ